MTRRPFAHRRRSIHDQAADHRGAPLAGDAGETLVESLVSVALMGTVVVAVLATLFAVMRATDVNRRLVRSGIGVTDVAESLEIADYHACVTGAEGATLQQYRTQIDFHVPGYDASVVDVQFARTSAGTVSFGPTCTGGDTGLQRLTVRLTTTTRPAVTQRLVFYKRATTCPAGYTRLFAGQPC